MSKKTTFCRECGDYYGWREATNEFLTDMKRAYNKRSLSLCRTEVRKTIEKWEVFQKE